MDKRQIKYYNRDFEALLKSLVDYVKYYYPNSFNDFSPASPAMVILELIAYVGDVLNFYLDKQTKQSILLYATQKEPIYNIAQSYGYKIKTAIPALVQLQFSMLVPVKNQNMPDYDYATILYPGTIVCSSQIDNSYFIVLNTINFNEPDRILDTQIQENHFKILVKKAYGYSVEYKTIEVNVGNNIGKSEYRIYLPDKNIVKIQQVKDINNNLWYEVMNIANDTVINPEVIYKNNMRVLKRLKTSKRFRTLVDPLNDSTFLYFASKITSDKVSQLNQLYKKFYQYDYNEIATPSLILLNNSYGEMPNDTTLYIKYLRTTEAIAPGGSIDTITYKQDYNVKTKNQALYRQLVDNIFVYNPSPSVGGQGLQSLQQIKQNALALINSQNRVVTQEDYLNAIKLMPAEYGNVAKSYVQKNAKNEIELWVLSQDMNKRLVKTNTQVKQNLGQFLQRYRMLGDKIVIKDAYIINIGCQFTIAVENNYSKQEVLFKVLNEIKQFFNIDNFQIGTPISYNLLRTKILSVEGVTNIIDLTLRNIKGNGYSQVYYDMDSAFDKNTGKYYTSYSPSIFEVLNPDIDIIGSVI